MKTILLPDAQILSPLHHIFVGERARVRGHNKQALTPALSRVAGEGAKSFQASELPNLFFSKSLISFRYDFLKILSKNPSRVSLSTMVLS